MAPTTTSKPKTKKQKKKQQDFQKPKLRVGKPKAPASNHTSTSFVSRTISLQSQSLSLTTPTITAQIQRHISLLRSKSASQRHDSLAYLTNLSLSELLLYSNEILPRLPSMLHDESKSVRSQLLKLLRRFPSEKIYVQLETILLWIMAGLNHISSDISSDALECLDFLLETSPKDVVSAKGAWIRMLRALMTAMGWKITSPGSSEDVNGSFKNTNGLSGMGKLRKQGGWSTYSIPSTVLSTSSFSSMKNGGSLLARQLNTLASCLAAGIVPSTSPSSQDEASGSKGETLFSPNVWPYQHLEAHRIPQRANAYARLNLFARKDVTATSEEAEERDQVLETQEDRRRVFREKKFDKSIKDHAEFVKRHAGEMGRAASRVLKNLEKGLMDA